MYFSATVIIFTKFEVVWPFVLEIMRCLDICGSCTYDLLKHTYRNSATHGDCLATHICSPDFAEIGLATL